MRREPAGDACHVSDPIAMGIGLNSASPNGAAGRVFLNWLTSTEFAALHARAIPGFFPLSDHAVEADDPLARAFLSWRGNCHSTFVSPHGSCLAVHPTWSRKPGTPPSAAITSPVTAEELGARLQGGLAGWYAPGQQAPAGGGPGGF